VHRVALGRVEGQLSWRGVVQVMLQVQVGFGLSCICFARFPALLRTPLHAPVLTNYPNSSNT